MNTLVDQVLPVAAQLPLAVALLLVLGVAAVRRDDGIARAAIAAAAVLYGGVTLGMALFQPLVALVGADEVVYSTGLWTALWLAADVGRAIAIGLAGVALTRPRA